MEQQSPNLEELVKGLKTQRDWVEEIQNLSLLISKLEGIGRVTSVRELAKLISRSKSWIGVSLILIKGLKLYPEIEKIRNRNAAYVFLQRKNKIRRFLES
jgi:hypothetical protein